MGSQKELRQAMGRATTAIGLKAIIFNTWQTSFHPIRHLLYANQYVKLSNRTKVQNDNTSMAFAMDSVLGIAGDRRKVFHNARI